MPQRQRDERQRQAAHGLILQALEDIDGEHQECGTLRHCQLTLRLERKHAAQGRERACERARGGVRSATGPPHRLKKRPNFSASVKQAHAGRLSLNFSLMSMIMESTCAALTLGEKCGHRYASRYCARRPTRQPAGCASITGAPHLLDAPGLSPAATGAWHSAYARLRPARRRISAAPGARPALAAARPTASASSHWQCVSACRPARRPQSNCLRSGAGAMQPQAQRAQPRVWLPALPLVPQLQPAPFYFALERVPAETRGRRVNPKHMRWASVRESGPQTHLCCGGWHGFRCLHRLRLVCCGCTSRRACHCRRQLLLTRLGLSGGRRFRCSGRRFLRDSRRRRSSRLSLERGCETRDKRGL